ncbi:MAG: septum formation protein Maf [Bacteroidia bacterium]|nr:septum formation protein Maf [Bacteroidia bacterium]
MSNSKKIILCSASPRRQMLLREIGVDFEIRTKDVNETFPDSLKGEQIAIYLAEKKTNVFLQKISNHETILTADTIVWLNDRMLGKPSDKPEAIEMLKELSGNKHTVYTAVCIADKSEQKIISASSEVYFRKLSAEEILFYVEHFNPLDKAGAYGAQECLPKGMNPCSTEEIEFLSRINKTEIIERSINKSENMVDAIKKIDGSFFNVMGLPLQEVYMALKSANIFETVKQ